MSDVTYLDHGDETPRSYSAGALFANLVFPCGQIPVDSQGQTPPDIAAQTQLCLDNLQDALLRMHSSAERILQVTAYLCDTDDFDAYDSAWRSWFGHRRMPPRTTVFVADFRGAKRIELTAVAAAQGRNQS